MSEDIIHRVGRVRETFVCGSGNWIVLNDAANDIAALKARVERLEAALRPFAEVGQLWLGSPIGDFHTIGIRASPDGEHTLTIGDFRAAAEALESQP